MGVDAVQIDDPDMAMLVDPSYRERMGITDVDREIELSLRCVNGAAADAGDTLVSVHFCHSHFDRRHTTTICSLLSLSHKSGLALSMGQVYV